MLCSLPFYQVNLGIYMQDSSMELSVLVDRSIGASSLLDGQVELMLHRLIIFLIHSYMIIAFIFSWYYSEYWLNMLVSDLLTYFFRRLLHDDSRGVGEVLNETVCSGDHCEGLTVKYLFWTNSFFTSRLAFARYCVKNSPIHMRTFSRWLK